MKSQLDLVQMATEIQRQATSKHDFVAPSSELLLEVIDNTPKLRVNGHGHFGINSTAHDQIAGRLEIPKRYYDRMLSQNPDLLAENVNAWLREEEAKLVRTLDGNIRAFLSDRYRPLDNFDLANTVIPIILAHGCRVESSALTETRLYIKAVTDRITFEVKKGDIVQAGIVISNSEVGHGSLKVEPLLLRLACLNGMIANDYSMKKYHIGKSNESNGAEEFFRNETRQADDKAFWMKVQDTVNGSFDKDVFAKIADKLTASTEKPIHGPVAKVVEVVGKKFNLSEAEGDGILTQLIKGADLTQYGLINAITRHSQDVESYDRATELERLGGTVLELPKVAWEEIANWEVRS